MVVLDVFCSGKQLAAVIDTGAGVSVCSPKLVRELGIKVTPWRANRLVSVDGKEIQLGGAAMLSVSDERMTVEGEALVLDGHVGKTWNADEDWGVTGDLHLRHCHRSTGGRDDGGSTETGSPEWMLGPTPIEESGRNSTTRFERVWRMCTGGFIPSIAEDEKGVDG
ncbi:hypothetical protein OUZ56_033052 [Daphnia magna]|uniref:Peptidase A2 domain-containing protein n=1 Tax=Daphnia magna TaxID=35525 RepID=A0ABR0BA40_9CRUS|nr:hypothetical protein OUZ56_033052 [Daphnia magna]